VLQAGGQQDLADEALLVAAVAGDQQLLEGDGAAEDRVVGASPGSEDPADAALGELGEGVARCPAMGLCAGSDLEVVAGADDLGLGEVEQRGAQGDRVALDAGAGGEVGELLEGGDEFGAAVGVAGVVEGVDAEPDLARAEGLGPAEGVGEEEGVAGGDVGAGDGADAGFGVFRDGERAGGDQRGGAGDEAADVGEVDDLVCAGAEAGGLAAGALELDGVALAVAEAEGVGLAVLGGGEGEDGGGVEAAAEEDDGAGAFGHV
jgi:hypothetical protein